eukprot:scaffold3150_cov51-Attheya_sp.AAC.20
MEENKVYILGLLQNLEAALDKWIVTGSLATRWRAYNIMIQVQRHSLDDELKSRASRMVGRAGMPLEEPPPLPPTLEKEKVASRTYAAVTGYTVAELDAARRKQEAEARTKWEAEFKAEEVTNGIKERLTNNNSEGRSALSTRAATNGKPDLGMANDFATAYQGAVADDFATAYQGARVAKDKEDLQKELRDAEEARVASNRKTEKPDEALKSESEIESAAAITSELVARAGAGSAFEGASLGIGGLDDVLAQVKRRIWVPLAAPPSLLHELGINPVRGLLLYGAPGCGKTLCARILGKILSPARPITVVSGPEIMDKFVGSSEQNLREIFDNPPDIYDSFRIEAKDGGSALSKAALHVIVLDEFDAMARSRGGSGGKGDQGDAGVARDSVVNQLLAKMDGVDALSVPTLVIGLTNKRTLIEPALLRPGRFEVQIEVPPPRTVPQRISILKVHMGSMYRAGRVLVRDAPEGTAAARILERKGSDGILSYDELLDLLAVECDGFSGAALAGVARAAASRALERSVWDFAGSISSGEAVNNKEGGSIADCLVTQQDFEGAIEDVMESSSGGDGGDIIEAKSEEEKDKSDDSTPADTSDGEITKT